jgi:CBS domain-containing protein
LGSEGREEQTLLTDQDNAILYDDPPPDREKEAAEYFKALGGQVCDWLDRAGYAFCQGGVMAKNPRWNLPLAAWRRQFTRWIHNADPQELLELNMVFDFRCVLGDPSLVHGFRQWTFGEMESHPPFFLHFAQNALSYKPPLGVLGNIQVASSGEGAKALNLKDALMPVVNYARLYTLKHRISDTHTLDRLGRLHEKGLLGRDSYQELATAYEALMRMRLGRQALALQDERRPDNNISPQDWSPLEETLLKQSFAVIGNLRKKISYDFLGMA